IHVVLALRADRQRGWYVPRAGRGEEACTDGRDRRRLRRRADRRSDARAADPVQPSRQCAEIHPAGDRERPCRHQAARTWPRAGPADSPLKSIRRPAEPVTGVAMPMGLRPRVLVVDDHPVNREVLVRQLDLLGFAADTAEDGVDALDAWAPGRYVAVLADIHM